MSRTVGWKALGLLALSNLGSVALTQGDYDKAARLFRETLSLYRELGIQREVSHPLAGLADVAVRHGQPERAARLLGAVGALMVTTGLVLDPMNRAEYDRTMTSVHTVLGEETFEAVSSEGRR